MTDSPRRRTCAACPAGPRLLVRGPLWLALALILVALPGTMLAQAPVPAVRATVTRVDDSAFPRVVLSMAVAGPEGLPVTGLDAGAFAVEEEGQAVQVVGVAPDTDQPLALVLALDRSTEAENWAALQAGAEAVLSGLGADDQVGVVVFSDQVEVVQPFTTDKAAAQTALAAVTEGGEFSALNPALVEAVTLAGRLDAPRRAVVLISDVPDNVSTLTSAQAVEQVQGAGVPVYVFGFGPRAQDVPEFAAIAAATGGQSASVADATAVQPALETLVAQLRQGYQVEFVSGLAADDQPHQALVTVQTPVGSAQAEGPFVARPGEVVVELLGWSEGQPVAGLLSLTSAVTAPAPLASVEYRVGAQLVGTAPDGATPVLWDTATSTPGDYELRVTAVDRAGNAGEAVVPLRVVAASPRLALAAVDDSTFPKVTAYVDAFGANGLPLVGLNAANFGVQVDGDAVVPEQVAAQTDATQPVQVVLVLDRSVPPADWAQIRNAANSLIDGMRPQDQVALYTFAGFSTLAQPPTGDRNALKSSLATVEAVPPAAAGESTVGENALNQALLDATNLAGTFGAGRRAVVVLTDDMDNTGTLPLAQTVDVLAGQPVPVHMFSYAVMPPAAATLAGLAQLTGGSSVVVNGAADLRSPLQTLALLLQQGYRLDFTSVLPADDRSHDLAVALTAPGLAAEATGNLIAQSAPVTVTIPNLAEGQTLGGTVDLTAQAQTVAPVTSVEYRLNDEVLAQVDDTSFSVIWDSTTVEPGAYVLEVTVTDAAGNQGEAAVNFTVVAPITLAAQFGARNQTGEVFVGDEVTVEAEVESLSGAARVDVYVDGMLVGSDERAPYSIDFGSSELAPGSRVITVVATDGEGHEVRSTLELPLVALPMPTAEPTAPPEPAALSVERVRMIDWGWWLRYGGLGGVLLLALVVLFILVRALRGAVKRQKPAIMRLSLSNLGNVATGYLLRGEDPAGLLTFRFVLNGVALGMPPVARFDRPAAGAGGAAVQGGVPAAGGPAFGMALPAGASGIKMPSSLGEVTGRIGEISAVARIISDILLSVAYILPPALARPIRTIVMQIRRGQMITRRVENIQRKVDKLNQTDMGQSVVRGTTEAATEVGRVATADSTREMVADAGQGVGSTVATAAGSAAAGAKAAAGRLFSLTAPANGHSAAAGAAAGVAGGVTAGGRGWFFLPSLNPGDTVALEVQVNLRQRPRQTDRYAFRLVSRPIGEDDAAPLIEEGSIQIEGPGWWRRLLWPAVLLVLAAVAAAVLWTLFSGPV